MGSQELSILRVLPTADVKASADEASTTSSPSWFQFYIVRNKQQQQQQQQQIKLICLACRHGKSSGIVGELSEHSIVKAVVALHFPPAPADQDLLWWKRWHQSLNNLENNVVTTTVPKSSSGTIAKSLQDNNIYTKCLSYAAKLQYLH